MPIPAAPADDMTPHPPPDRYELFDRYHARVRRFVMAMVKDDWLADDIAQETFVRAMRHADRIKDPSRWSSWLFRVAHNLCRDHFRSDTRNTTDSWEDPDSLPLAQQADAGTALERHEMSACVRRQVEKLPAPYRSTIWLFDVQGFSLKETAGILDISVANVKVRLHRSRSQLKDILVENCLLSKDERDVLVCEPRCGGLGTLGF
jgi:RNA polymerase sigma-70 factor (ECF subfamily)